MKKLLTAIGLVLATATMTVSLATTPASAATGVRGPHGQAAVSCGNTYIRVTPQLGPTRGYEFGQRVGVRYWVYDWQVGRYTLDTTRYYSIQNAQQHSWGSVTAPGGMAMADPTRYLDISARNGLYSIYVQYTWFDSAGRVLGSSDPIWTSAYTNYTAPYGYPKTAVQDKCRIQPGMNQAAYGYS